MQNTSSKTGFTLIEVIVVIIIMATLASLALVKYNTMAKTQGYHTAVMNLKTLYTADEIYKIRHGHYYPNSLADISAINTAFGTNITADPGISYSYWMDAGDDADDSKNGFTAIFGDGTAFKADVFNTRRGNPVALSNTSDSQETPPNPVCTGTDLGQQSGDADDYLSCP